METEQILNCSHKDFLQILSQVEEFWETDRTLSFHHPMFVNEFSNTSYVIKQGDKVLAYLFGFISQAENIGYVHLVGVRRSFQRKGLGKKLYDFFSKDLKQRGVHGLKAITTPSNTKSINFHLKIGMEMIGEPLDKEIKIVKNYSGLGQDRVVFLMKI